MTKVEDLLSLRCISKVTRCLYILAMLVSKDYAYYGPKLSTAASVKEKKNSVPGKVVVTRNIINTSVSSAIFFLQNVIVQI